MNKKENIKVKKSNEIIGLVYLLISIFLGIAFYIPKVNSGPLGQFLVNLGKGMIGSMAYSIPLLFLVLSISSFLEDFFSENKIRIKNIFWLIILVSALVHSVTVKADVIKSLSIDSENRSTVLSSLEILWKASQNPNNFEALLDTLPGGIIAGSLSLGLQRVIGHVATIIFIITAIVAEAIIIGNFSISRILITIMAITSALCSATQEFFTSIFQDIKTSHAENARRKALLDEQIYNDNTEKNHVNFSDSIESSDADLHFTISSPRTTSFEIESFHDRKTTPTLKMHDLNIGSTSQSSNSSIDNTKKTADFFEIPRTAESEYKAPDFLLDETTVDKLDGSVKTDNLDQTKEFDKLNEVDSSLESDFIIEGLQNNSLSSQADYAKGYRNNIYPEKSSETNKNPVKPILFNEQVSAPSTQSRGPISALGNKSLNNNIINKKSDSPNSLSENLAEEKEKRVVKMIDNGAVTSSDVASEKPYEFPPIELLEPRPVQQKGSTAKLIKEQAETLESTLSSFGVEAKVIHVTTGPSITRFELRPGRGVKISKIVNLSDDIALALAATTVRIEAPIPGKSAIGIEIPNKQTAIVGLRSLLEDESFQNREDALLVPLARDIPGQAIYCNLQKMPHLLVAGATGSGKSICINTILMSLLYGCSPEELRLLLIDPKVVELSIYNGIPHLLAPVVTDPSKAANTLNWLVQEMERRYQMFALRKTRDMAGYNKLIEKEGGDKLPFIVLIIDELSDLMMTSPKEVEDSISRLTAMARAAGIHLIIATQRPSVDVITGVIKANIPSRIAFAVSSQVDSRTILDGSGAEKLLGKGDMLYFPQSASKPLRGQGAYVSDSEVQSVIAFLKAQGLESYDQEIAKEIVSTKSGSIDNSSNEDEEDDELFDEAVDLVVENQYASVSLLQRRLNIGYPRAGRLIDSMEAKGYIGPHAGSKPRDVILSHEEWALIKAGAWNDSNASSYDDENFE